MYQASWPASCSCWASWEPQCPCEEVQQLWLHHSAAGLPEHRRRTWAWGESSACTSTDQLISAMIHFRGWNYLEGNKQTTSDELSFKGIKTKTIYAKYQSFCFSNSSASQLAQEWSSYPYRDPCPAELRLPILNCSAWGHELNSSATQNLPSCFKTQGRGPSASPPPAKAGSARSDYPKYFSMSAPGLSFFQFHSKWLSSCALQQATFNIKTGLVAHKEKVGWQRKMVEPDSAGETLVLLGIIVFQADLQLHWLHKPKTREKLGCVVGTSATAMICSAFLWQLTFLAWSKSPAGLLSQPRTKCLWRPYCNIFLKDKIL